MSNIDKNILLKDKYISFSYNELVFITDEFDFEIENIWFESTEHEGVEIYIKLFDNNDTQEILNLQEKRKTKIDDELKKLKALKESL